MVSVGDEVNPTEAAEPQPSWPAVVSNTIERLFGTWGPWARFTLLLLVLFSVAVVAAWLLGVAISIGPISITRG